MNHALLKAADKLSLALKQSEQAHRNLRLLRLWAQRNDLLHLDQGAQDLAHRMDQLAADIRSLVVVLRAQAEITRSDSHQE